MPISETSPTKDVAAVAAENTAGGVAVAGTSTQGRGVEGRSTKGVGVVGISEDYRGIEGRSTNEHAILGRSTKGSGVAGISEDNRGVHGRSTNEHGVFGESAKGAGVAGFSETYRGVHGRSTSGQGVWGSSTASIGVAGVSESGEGVRGTSKNGIGVRGTSQSSPAVWGASDTHEGVHAETKSTKTAAIAAYQTNSDSPSAAIFAMHAGEGPAARFEGIVEVKGDVRLTGGDLAEHFEVTGAAPAPAGSVMVLAGQDRVRVADKAYDRRVAGVVSGARDYRPAVVLDTGRPGSNRQALALSGKVWVLVDADHGAVDVGDLLTTSPTSGHAMRADDPTQAFGSVLGKALDPLPRGSGLIRALVALQ